MGPRLCYYRPHDERREASFAQEVAYGMSKNPKQLNPKFFYNMQGSILFDRICRLPEYYLTRTEICILEQMQDDLAEFLNGEYRLVELGSGSAVKTRLILDILDRTQSAMEFLPIDISEVLSESSLALLESYPKLCVTGVMDAFESGLDFVKRHGGGPNLIAFLGSSLGNFEQDDADSFLRQVGDTMTESDLFLIGLDMVKERNMLEAAYNDSQGVTARFNLNILSRINEELGGDFVLENFEHHSKFNAGRSRMEMHLRSKTKQHVRIPKSNQILQMDEGELIHTENSHKYTIPGITSMMNRAGLDICRIWQDKLEYYSVVLTSRRNQRT